LISNKPYKKSERKPTLACQSLYTLAVIYPDVKEIVESTKLKRNDNLFFHVKSENHKEASSSELVFLL